MLRGRPSNLDKLHLDLNVMRFLCGKSSLLRINPSFGTRPDSSVKG